MPMLDHFHPPLFPERAWEAFHAGWAYNIARNLNRRLPPRFFAQAPAHLGPSVAADVAEVDRGDGTNDPDGGLATLTYAPAAARIRIPLSFPSEFVVRVHDLDRAGLVVGVVELVSPSNKDRDSKRRLFAAKCAGYLSFGIGLIVADLVTSRRFNLHNQLVRDAGYADDLLMPEEVVTYAVAYRPAATRDGDGYADVWPHPLAIGDTLPTLPLALRGLGCVPIDLEALYAETCVDLRLP